MAKKRLKIGMFLDTYYPAIDGVVMVVDNLACELAKTNDVTLIVPDMKGGADIKRPYDIIRVKSVHVPFSEYSVAMPHLPSAKRRKILKKHFDVIHVHSPFVLGLYGIQLAKKLNVPVIGTVHTNYEGEVLKIMKSRLLTKLSMKIITGIYNKYDTCIVVNEPVVGEIKKFGYRHKPVVIHNATTLLPPADREKSAEKLNRLLGIDKDDIVLIFVGRITDTKNIFFLLKALRLLKADGASFKMLYVGAGPDEKLLKAKIHEYGMTDCVKMTGRIKNREHLSEIYSRADLLLFPSLVDTFGLVSIEAAVNSTPTLFAEGTMAASLVTDGVNGFVAPVDEIKYCNRIKEIIGNKELLKKASQNAHDTLGESMKSIAEKTYNEYIKAVRRCKKKK